MPACLLEQVKARHGTNYQMFIPEAIVDSHKRILQLLNVTCGREDISVTSDPQVEGYLLLVNCDEAGGGDASGPRWDGREVGMELTAETTIALVHIEVGYLIRFFILLDFSHTFTVGRRWLNGSGRLGFDISSLVKLTRLSTHYGLLQNKEHLLAPCMAAIYYYYLDCLNCAYTRLTPVLISMQCYYSVTSLFNN